MDKLSSEILLAVFKNLNSARMVKVLPVCRRWLEIIDENKSLWRHLILRDRKDGSGWEPAALILFDHKCQSTLKEVSMEVKKLDAQDSDAFCQVLEKSKDTLQTMDVSDGYGFVASKLSNSFVRFPNLINCIDLYSCSEKVELCERLEGEGRDEAPFSNSSHPKLKVLWTRFREALDTLNLPFITNLASLSMAIGITSSEWKRILKGPSRTLKHLRMHVDVSDVEDDVDSLLRETESLLEEEWEEISITFPKLKVLEFSSFSRSAGSSAEPQQWMEAPSISVLITNARKSSLLSSSSPSTLWVEEDSSWHSQPISHFCQSSLLEVMNVEENILVELWRSCLECCKRDQEK